MALVEALGAVRAIVRAQWQSSRNFFPRAGKGGLTLQWLMGLIWYGGWATGAAGAGFLVSGRVPMAVVERALPGALFLVFFLWQLLPIVLASQGAFLDMKRLLVYPIPDNQLFLLETVLRVSSALEMILVCVGLMVGLLLNRDVPFWGPLAIVIFMALNLLLATAIKSLLDRLFKKKGVRELTMVGFLGLILAPQFLAAAFQDSAGSRLPIPRGVTALFEATPWAAAASLALGRFSGLAVAGLTASVAIAYAFARLQFARSLRLDEAPGGGRGKTESTRPAWFDRAARWPGALLPDPLAAMTEKDLRTLWRSPRFRLIFLMGSTFGALLWLPQALRDKEGWLARNYVTMATLYCMLVLGEVLYWNVFGFERTGVQHWFVTPVRFRDVMRAKNLAAAFYTLLAVVILSATGLLLPVGAGAPQILDALAAASVLLLCTMGGGNLTSVYMPRPIDAEQAWRNSGGKMQLMLLFAYPALSIPVVMAQLARWATGSYWAYHGVLGAAFLVALCFYNAATETAVEAAEERKEQIVAALSRQDGPVSLNN